MKKLAVTFSSLTAERLVRIKEVATGYEVLQLDPNDERILDCEVVFGHMQKEYLSQSNHLKWLHVHFAGVDSLLKKEVDFPENVILTNSAGTYGTAISEYLLGVTLMLMRRSMEYAKLQFANKWQPLGEIKCVYGSKICVVGLGDIGENYAKRCKALGATVIGVARTARPVLPDCVDVLYSIEDLDLAVADADVVALCLPGTPATVGLFDADRLAKLKPGALLLNIGRGTAINTEALISALENGKIGGAALDVTDPEPLPVDSPLWQMENVIITPHVSGNQTLTNDLIVGKFVKYLEDYVAGRPFERVVDKKLGY